MTAWSPNGSYVQGQHVSHAGRTWVCLQSHRCYGDVNWAPGTAPSLWGEVASRQQGPTPQPGPVALPAAAPAPVAHGNALLFSGDLLVAYYESWGPGWADKGEQMDLARLPPSVNVVILAFVRPDCSYQPGSFNLTGTGLQFNNADGRVLRDAISLLKAQQPWRRVLLGVGGATYRNFGKSNIPAIEALVNDLGAHGIDLDWEPANPACVKNSDGKVVCATDAEGAQLVAAFRNGFPRDTYIVSAATFHVGCYGTGAFAGSRPGSEYTGVNLAMSRTAAGQQLDLINIMAYDAGNLATTGFDPLEALRATRAAFPTAALALGVQVPPEAWGGNMLTVADVERYTAAVKAHGGQGLMIWAWRKQASPPGAPNAQAIAAVAQQHLQLGA